MKRHIITPRKDWKNKAEEIGFTYHTCGAPSADGEGTYWDESVAYEFSMEEIDTLEEATKECQLRCLDVVDKVVNTPELMVKLGIPAAYHRVIIKSWKDGDPSLYGRFDFAYDGTSSPKMLEYNADTPTMVIESALMQWFWLQDVKPGMDQFNSLHEELIRGFEGIKRRMAPGSKFHFAGYEDSLEEYQTCRYFQDLATQAGLNSDFIHLPDIGWNGSSFVDTNEEPMKYWFKLYPWEWMMGDEFGTHLSKNASGVMEPIWKSILSNKGMLPLLYEMFPDHPNILPASFNLKDLPVDEWDWVNLQTNGTPAQLDSFSAGEFNPGTYVIKPMLSREGANIDIVQSGRVISKTDGDYVGPRIYQKKADLFLCGDNRAVIGSWVVGDTPAGIIIRDHDQDIVLDTSRVVPHWIAV